MTWIELDDGFATSAPVIRAGPLAAWLHIFMLCRFAGRSAARVSVDDIAEVLHVHRASGPDVAERLVDAGLWRAVQGGWEIVDGGHHRFVRKTSPE